MGAGRRRGGGSMPSGARSRGSRSMMGWCPRSSWARTTACSGRTRRARSKRTPPTTVGVAQQTNLLCLESQHGGSATGRLPPRDAAVGARAAPRRRGAERGHSAGALEKALLFFGAADQKGGGCGKGASTPSSPTHGAHGGNDHAASAAPTTTTTTTAHSRRACNA